MNCIQSTIILLQHIQSPTSYHTARFKLLDRDSHGNFGEKYCDEKGERKLHKYRFKPDVLDRINRMNDKEMCTVEIKPKTKIGMFSLEKPKLLRFKKRKINFNPKEEINMPGTIKRQFYQNRYYTGICI